MIIQSLSIANMRGIQKENCEFHPQFNVLVGINGKGKTTILESIAAVLSRHMPLIVPLRDEARKLTNEDIRDGEVFTDIFLKLGLNDESIIIGLRRELKGAVKTYRDGIGDWRTWAAMFDFETYPHPIAVYYTTDRAAGHRPTRRRKRGAELNQYTAYQGSLTDEVIDFGAVSTWFALRDSKRENPNSVQQSPEVDRVLAAAKEALRLFLPDFEGLEVDYNARGLPNLVAVKNVASFNSSASENEARRRTALQLHQLSDGERGVLAMVFDLAKRLTLANPNLSDPIKEGTGIVLIDELELHLHPSWQRSIVENLRNTFPKLQFITTSHSPFVVQSLRPASDPSELIDLDPLNFEAEYSSNTVEYSNRSIEDITEEVFDVKLPQKSERYLEMVKTAEEYYRLLETASQSNEQTLELLKDQLDELQMRYSDDPAFTAFLKFQREFKLGEQD